MDLLDLGVDDVVLTVDERKHLNLLALELEMSPDKVAAAHEQYFRSMVIGAERDGIITVEENKAFTSVARALGMPLDRVPATSETTCGDGDIAPGSAICFTGSCVDANGNALSKGALEALAKRCGFNVVSSVTQSKCDYVVVVDPNSLSGKAKKARDHGKPVFGSDRFIEIVKQQNSLFQRRRQRLQIYFHEWRMFHA